MLNFFYLNSYIVMKRFRLMIIDKTTREINTLRFLNTYFVNKERISRTSLLIQLHGNEAEIKDALKKDLISEFNDSKGYVYYRITQKGIDYRDCNKNK